EMGGLTIALQSTSEGAELQPTSRHEYAWRHTDTGTGTGTGQDGGPAVPTAFALEEAYPNPFNPSTRLTYRLSESGPVALRVYDVLGRRVATLVEGIRPAGSHEVAFDAGGLSGGLYLVRLETAHGHAVRSVTLLK
ncbi:MAG: T9SS type A sorting domain-containing protein, partial [Rhodothermales bacterium]